MINTQIARAAVLSATIALTAQGLAPTAAFAQNYPQGNYPQSDAPPPGQYAPPPGQYAPPPGDDYGPQGQSQYGSPPPQGGPNGPSSYDPRARQYDQGYAQNYSQWAAQYCVDRRNNNTAAGAVIGGILGAVLGSNLSGRHDRGGGAVVGGVLGAGAGAVVGSSTGNSSSCPPGYVVRGDAPPFDYGDAYPAAVIYGPSWYNPWFFTGGHWMYRPYRSWYWGHPNYWRGGPRGGHGYYRHGWRH